MYIPEFNAFLIVRSKSRNTHLMAPDLPIQEIQRSRYVLFNNETTVTKPLTFSVYKSRVDICGTDFYQHLLELFPSMYHSINQYSNVIQIIIPDESDTIRFLLMYN